MWKFLARFVHQVQHLVYSKLSESSAQSLFKLRTDHIPVLQAGFILPHVTNYLEAFYGLSSKNFCTNANVDLLDADNT